MNLPEPYRGNQNGEIIDVRAVPVPAANDRLDIRAILTTFYRRFWLFLIVFGVIFGIAIVLTFSQTPTYTATARVMLDVNRQEVAPTDGQQTQQLPGQSSSDSAIDTEVEVIRSRALAEQVVRDLNLEADPEFNPYLPAPATAQNPLQKAMGAVMEGIDRIVPSDAQPAPATSAQPVMDDIIDTLLAGLSSQRVGTTYAIDLYVSGTDPEKVAKIANSFASLYTRYKLGQKVDENQQAVGLLDSRIEDLRRQAEEDTAAVQQYRIANNLLSSSGASLTEQEISAYNQQVTLARAQAAEDEARLNTARNQLRSGSAGDDVGEALGSPVVQSLRSQRAAVSAKVADLQGRYLPRHPEILTAQRELSDIDAQIQGEINRVISNLEARAQVSRQRLASLQNSLGGARGSLRSNNQAMVRLDELTRKAATSQSLYESYLARLGQTAAAEGTLRADSRVISEARIPIAPSSPNIPLNLALGLLLWLGAGVIAAFAAEMLSSSFTTGEEIEQRLGRAFLGSIPIVSSVDGAGTSPLDSLIRHPHSAFAESFRSLRTSLQFMGDSESQVVLITSALPQEGKTTTSIGLARSAALQGKRVVLIDADLRKRGLNRLIKQGRPISGLLEVLSREVSFSEALVEDEPTGAHVLPIGKLTEDKVGLLTGEAMDGLIAELRENYDLIVIDAPPVLPIADARGLATKADAVVFVIRWRKTAEQAVRLALRLLPRDQTRIAGIALTRVDMRKQSRFGYGDAGYYYNQYKNYYA